MEVRKVEDSSKDKCKKIVEVDCSFNCLASLNLKANKKLKKLYCSENNLQKVVFPANKKLKCRCDHNFFNQSGTSKIVKRFGKKNVKPQDKASSKIVGYAWLKSATSDQAGRMKIDYSFDGHCSLIQIQIKEIHAKKWSYYNNGRKSSRTFTGLKPNKTYKVRVRSKLKVRKKWYVGKWSNAMTVTIKD